MDKAQVGKIFRSLDLSEQSLRECEKHADAFVSYVDKHGISYDCFVDFKRSLASRDDVAVSTKNKRLWSARKLLKELHRRGALAVDVTENVRSFGQSRGHRVDGLTEEEVGAVVKTLATLQDNLRNRRTKAMFALLLVQGLRQIEVVRLDVEDLDLTNGTALVHGKGDDERVKVHLAPQTICALRQHLLATSTKTGPVFKSFSDRPSERLTTQSVNRDVKELFARAGVDKCVHGLRHYFTTRLLKDYPVHVVQTLTRHKSLNTLICYFDEMHAKEKAQEALRCMPDLGLDSMTTSLHYQSYTSAVAKKMESEENRLWNWKRLTESRSVLGTITN